MDIQYAILGFLNWRSFSGYDIKKMISDSEVFYWSGNNNQIYNSLIAMHKEGLVTQETFYQASLPARKVYTITDKGKQALQLWLHSSPELPELRNNFLIQLSWADLLPDRELDDLLQKYEEEIAVQLRMQQMRADNPIVSPDRTPRERYLWRKISENLVAVYQSELEWVRSLREDLSQGKDSIG